MDLALLARGTSLLVLFIVFICCCNVVGARPAANPNVMVAPSDKVVRTIQALQADGFEPEHGHVMTTLRRGGESHAWHSLSPFDEESPLATVSRKDVEKGGDAYDFLPKFIGSVVPDAAPAKMTGRCFSDITGTISLTTTRKGENKATLYLDAQEPSSKMCMDILIVSVTTKIHIKPIFFSGKHSLVLHDLVEGEMEDLVANGVHVFQLNAQPTLDVLLSIYHTLELFVKIVEDPVIANRDFLENQMNITLEDRAPYAGNEAGMFAIPEDMIETGDVFFISTVRGLGTVISFFTGAFSSHMATALWHEDELYVTESTDPEPFAPRTPGDKTDGRGVIRTPYREWLVNNANANELITFAKLREDVQLKFDEDAALQYFLAHEGDDYGYRNFMYTAVDTPEANTPPQLPWEVEMWAVPLLEMIEPLMTDITLIRGMGMRMGNPEVSNFQEIVDWLVSPLNVDKLTLGQLAAIPEEDEWVYEDGPNLVCSSFVAGMFQAGGLLHKATRVTEQTPKDVTQYNLYRNDDAWYTHDPVTTAACEGSIPGTCQLFGGYWLPVTGFNTVSIYPHMNEHCATWSGDSIILPEDRQAGC